MEKHPHTMTPEQVLAEYHTTRAGLSTAEARRRLAENGANALATAKKRSKWAMFFAQFKDFMLLILIAAAVVTGVVALVTKTYEDLIDVGIILAIVILNAIIGFIQENKAENALASLKKMSESTARVMRDGKIVRIPTTEIVAGDVVYFEAGDVACADCYIIESASLKADESSLTGESIDVEKQAGVNLAHDIALGDRCNMLHSGCVVTYGNGVGVVVKTGMNTEIGKIAGMIAEQQDEKTPIQQKLDKLGKWITVGILAIAVVIFIINVVIKDSHDVLDALLVAIAIAVAAIPESLPAVITVIMATGVSRMSKQRAIIRKMHAVETLGSCQIICTDKTGTITQNKMTLSALYTNGRLYHKAEMAEINNSLLFNCMMLCNDCIVQGDEVDGDPTETVLVVGARKLGVSYENITAENPRITELPFDNVRKMMTSLNRTNGELVAYTKGAPDLVLDRCSRYFENGKVTKMTENKRAELADILEQTGQKGLRTLAFAYKPHKAEKLNFADESDLIFLGISAVRDPPRETSAAAVSTCIAAGIKPVMITGDYPTTAREIAREVGIYRDGDMILTGAELDKLSEAEYQKIIKQVSVYARVSPENKVRIVNGWKATGAVVAMTGDGVNDAPSIKAADIGIGMGKSGTEVTKEVADMVLTDDNFATIVGAVSEGRKIYTNIKKVIQFLFGTNFVEVLTILLVTLISPALGFLTAMQILFINLITDALPALSLSVERAENDIMSRPPRPKSEGLFAGIWGSMITQVLWQTACVVGAFYITYSLTGDNTLATTFAFTVLSLSQVFHLINVRNTHSIFTVNPFHNKFFWITLAVCFAINIAIVAIPPVAAVFGLTPLTITQWLIVFGVAITIIPVIELYKVIERAVKKKRSKQIKK